MFYINKETTLDEKLLSKMINKFVIGVQPKLQKYKDYYDGAQAILNKRYTDASKPCNKTVINYAKNIVDSYDGYLATPGMISYKSTDDIEEIMNILRYNDYQAEDSAFLLDALVYGTAAELMYLDEKAQTRFRLINPTTCFGIYDDSLTGDLLYFVRIYKASEWDDSDLYYMDVYDDVNITHYEMAGMSGTPVYKEQEPHHFSQCPANIFSLPDERSIFDCIIPLQDAVNEVLSSEIDDYSAFCDAYLALIGVDAEAEDIAAMKANRVMILPSDASATWITKGSNDVQVENILKRIHDSIYRIAACPDFSSENFVGGVSSGIALKFKLSGMELRAGKIEAEMKKALQRRVEIICGIATLKLGEEVFRDITIEFKRNVPTDTTEIISLVNTLKGTVSDATLLTQLPFVSDVQEELNALDEQRRRNMSLYSFTTGDDEE